MKLTLKIKLLPTNDQAALLLQTMRVANAAYDFISEKAWQEKIFNKAKLHNQVYYPLRSKFKLSSQMLIRSIAKVCDAYALDKKTKRKFNPLGAIAYDARILTYKPNNVVSLWCLGGRQKINFVCHKPEYFSLKKGEADLVYKKGKFFLCQTIEVPPEESKGVDDFIGCDFGITDIVVTSDGVKHPADGLNTYREHRQKVRSSIRAKTDTSKRSTKRNCRKLSKRLQGKERTHASIMNHTIAKAIILTAKQSGKGVAIEDLTNIRFTSKRRNKKFRTKLGRWSFGQLRLFLEYKGLLYGVPVVVVDPRYTSQTCNVCKHIGKPANKHFKCSNCGSYMDADANALINIATLGGAVNRARKSNAMSCTIAHMASGLKPNPSLRVVG